MCAAPNAKRNDFSFLFLAFILSFASLVYSQNRKTAASQHRKHWKTINIWFRFLLLHCVLAAKEEKWERSERTFLFSNPQSLIATKDEATYWLYYVTIYSASFDSSIEHTRDARLKITNSISTNNIKKQQLIHIVALKITADHYCIISTSICLAYLRYVIVCVFCHRPHHPNHHQHHYCVLYFVYFVGCTFSLLINCLSLMRWDAGREIAPYMGATLAMKVRIVC